jgi:polyphosphate kinase
VKSIVGRFLEHSRIYFFENGGENEVYVGSPDLMPRNLDRRVEILFPIIDKSLVCRLRDSVLETYLADDVKARIGKPDGTYEFHPVTGANGMDSQQWFIEHRSAW